METVTTPDGVEIDIHSPPGSGPFPVVVFLHGSPPVTKEDVSVIAEALASRGALVYNVGYSQSGREGVVGSVVNVACAVAFARETAATYGGDDSRITLAGLSGGGWAGADVALGGDVLGANCDSDQSSLPDAFVGISGAYEAATREGTIPEDLLPDPEDRRSVDPYAYVGENPSLQVWLIHGEEDTMWPLSVAKDFYQTLRGEGYDAELVVLAGATHDIPDPEDQDTVLTTIITAAQKDS